MLDEDSQRAQRGEREREAGRGGGVFDLARDSLFKKQ